jgi:hypothetical protein
VAGWKLSVKTRKEMQKGDGGWFQWASLESVLTGDHSVLTSNFCRGSVHCPSQYPSETFCRGYVSATGELMTYLTVLPQCYIELGGKAVGKQPPTGLTTALPQKSVDNRAIM